MTDFKPFTYVLGRDNTDKPWMPDIFIKYEGENWKAFQYRCLGSSWKCCIPYEGNEHLVYTTGNTYNPELGDIVRYRLHGDRTFIGIIHKIDGTLITVVPIHKDRLYFINIDIKDILHKIDQQE